MAKKGVVEVIIEAKDLTGRALASFRRRWQAATRVVRDMTRAVVAGTVAFVGMVAALQKLGVEGDKVIAVKQAFARITGDETAALNKLRQAARGTIDDFRLMALANQAITLGAAENVEQFAEMVEISRALGRAQGVDALSALESFTIGMARQSPRILDNIGLQIKLGDTTTFAARAMEQARQKAAELTGGLEQGAVGASQFSTALVNLKNRLSEVVAESPLVAEFFDGLTGIVSDIIDLFAGDTELLIDGMKTVGRMAGDAFSIGVNEGIEAFIDKGNPFGRWVASFFGGNADVARGNLAANREALASIARASQAGAQARSVSARGPATTGAPVAVSGGGIVDIGRALPSGMGMGDEWTQFRRQRNLAAGARAGLGDGLPSLEPMFGDGGEIADAAEGIEDFGATAIAAFGSAAQAGIRGSEQIAQSVISMFTDIARSIPDVGGIGGALIGAVGGIFGAIAGRGRRDPVPVSVRDIDDAAAAKLRDQRSGPERVEVTVLGQDGRSLEYYQKGMYDREQRDEIVRHGARVGGTPVGVR